MKDVISCRKIPPPPQRGTINFVSELLTFNGCQLRTWVLAAFAKFCRPLEKVMSRFSLNKFRFFKIFQDF